MIWYSKNETITDELTESIVIQKGATVEISGVLHGDVFIHSGGKLIVTGEIDGSVVGSKSSKLHLYGRIYKGYYCSDNLHNFLTQEFGSLIDSDWEHLKIAMQEHSNLLNN